MRNTKTLILLLLSFVSIATAQTVGFQDPEGVIKGVRTADGQFTQFETDLVIVAPDSLVLTRFYDGCWRIVPQAYLVLGDDQIVYTGEPFGGLLKYKNGKVNFAGGMVNTYRGEASGRSNLQNNRLSIEGETCEIILGDGTKRIYKLTEERPSKLFWAYPEVQNAKIYRLESEKLPSGNVLVYVYENGNIFSIEMKDLSKKRVHAWIHFAYQHGGEESLLTVSTSDERNLEYHFQGTELKKVDGSHCVSVIYKYEDGKLNEKQLPGGRYLKIEYDGSHVKELKEPPPSPKDSEIAYTFEYGKGFTDVFNGLKIKTRHVYDEQKQLIAIEEYSKNNELYREIRKYWEENKLKAFSLADGKRDVYSLQRFEYDEFGNIESESLFGNLTGEKEIVVKVDAAGKITNPEDIEKHEKKYTYTKDGLNLLSEIEDVKKSSVQFKYKDGTNQLISKFIQKDWKNVKRTFYSYDLNGVCIQIIEDDGFEEDENDLYKVKERHITQIKPKKTIPGIGLPEVVEEKAYDLNNKKDIVVSKVTHSYFPQGQLKSSCIYGNADSPIYKISKTYTNLGQVQTETDEQGCETTYEYDLIGNLIFTSIPHQKRTIERKYDLKNRCYQKIEKVDGLESKEQYGFDCFGNQISFVDRFGQITRFDFDEFNRLEKMTNPKISNEEAKEIEPTVSYTYDIFDNVLTVTNAKGYVTANNYTIRGKLSKVLYPDGTRELFKYDPEGSLHRSLSRTDEVTVYEYDDQGRLSYQETSKMMEGGKQEFLRGHTYEYNAFRLLSEYETNLGMFEPCIRFHHDPAGRIVKKVLCDRGYFENDPSSRITEFIYDPLGRIEKEKIWFGVGPNDYFYEIYKWDFLGQLEEKRIEDAKGKALLQRLFNYDVNGFCTEESSFHNGKRISLSKTLYDAFGEPISFTDSYGNETIISVDRSGKTLRKTLTDPLGTQTELEFDAKGYLISSIKKDKQGLLLASQKFGYDLAGNKCTEINDVIFQGRSSGSQISRWIYGPMNRLEGEIRAAGLPEEIETTFTYDKYGRLETKSLKGVLEPILYSYDPKTGWLSQIKHQSKAPEKAILNTYKYDKAGNLISALSKNGIQIDREYNVFGDVVNERIQHEEDVYISSKLSYKYDRLGRLAKITLPDQSHIKYIYDEIYGRRIERTSDRIYFQHSYDLYDDQGKLIEETSPVGLITRTYDSRGRSMGRYSSYFAETVSELGYNPLNCLLEIERKGIFPVQNGQYEYDLLSQLSSELLSAYNYDSLGNCKIFNQEEFKYNGLNQLYQTSVKQYSFDSQGNLSKKIACGLETKFSHNILSQLVAVEKEDGLNYRYLYDPLGRRIVKETYFTKSTSRTQLAYFLSFYWEDQELGDVDETEKIQHLRVPGINGSKISQNSIAIEIGEKPFTPIHDISGNIVAIIDPFSKSVVESYVYSAFGEKTVYNSKGEPSSRSLIDNPWGYKEKRFDDETKLTHFGLRLYDPEIHRWTTRDPLGSLDGPNQYCFLHNNPLTHFDTLGLATEDLQKEGFHDYFYGEVENHCYCERHRTCKRGGDIGNNRLGGIATGISDYYMKTAEFFLQTPLALYLAPSLKNGYENFIQSNLNQLHEMWDEGLENLIDFDSFNEQTLRYKNAAGIGLSALDLIRGNVRGIRRGLSFFKNSVIDFDISLLAKAGQVIDRKGLTRAGRALEKHGNRSGSVFPKAIGNPATKNAQGQLQLEAILTDPNRIIIKDGTRGFKIYSSDGRGAYFYKDRTFRGFIERQYE